MGWIRKEVGQGVGEQGEDPPEEAPEPSEEQRMESPEGGGSNGGDFGARHVAPIFRDSAVFEIKSGYRVEEFLGFEDEEFLGNAYLAVLQRDLDDTGRERFLPRLQVGRLSKIEVLAWLRYSPEGRSKGVPIRGRLLARGLMRASFRIPVVGYVLALANYLVKLPALAANLENLESQLRRQASQNMWSLKALDERLLGSLDDLDRHISEDLWTESSKKVDKDVFFELSHRVADRDELDSSAARLTAAFEGAQDQLSQNLEAQISMKADGDAFVSLSRRAADKDDLVAMGAQFRTAFAVTKKKMLDDLDGVETKLMDAFQAAHEQTSQSLWEALVDKADKEPFLDLLQRAADKEDLNAVEVRLRNSFQAEHEQTSKDLWEALVDKADKEPFFALSDRAADKEELNAVEAQLRNSFQATQEQLSQSLWEAVVEKVDKDWYEDRYAELQGALQEVNGSQQDLLRKVQEQKVAVLDQQRRLLLLLEEARRRMPEPFAEDQVASIAAAADHWLDAHYLSFEDAFRGTREEIKRRAEVYLPVVRSAKAGTSDRPILDLGCGRGELLELLKEQGLVGRGIDQNQILVSQCHEQGLDVIEMDAVDYLKGLPDGSVGAITGLHIIEHIPFDRLTRLLDEALRVLRPGGVVAFETPNPENLVVGACNFYYDPTHLHPLPPPVTQFLLEARGFVRVEIQRLSADRSVETLPPAPSGRPDSEALNRVIELINTHFGAAPDFAVIGYKA